MKKIDKLLTKVQPFMEPCEPVEGTIVRDDHRILVKTKDGKYYFFTGARQEDVEGIVGGYNINAVSIAYLLCELDELTPNAVEDFHDWYMETGRKQSQTSAINEAIKLLRHEGYKVE